MGVKGSQISVAAYAINAVVVLTKKHASMRRSLSVATLPAFSLDRTRGRLTGLREME